MRKYLITSSYFYDEEDDDSEPVEHVVDCCSSKGPTKFIAIAHLCERDESIGGRSSNIGSHNDRNSYGYRQNYFKRNNQLMRQTFMWMPEDYFQQPPCLQRWMWKWTSFEPGRDFSANHFSGIFRLIFNKYWHLGYFYHIDHVTCGPTTNQTKGWGQKVQRANEKIKKHKNSDGFSDTNPDSHRFFAWFQF